MQQREEYSIGPAETITFIEYPAVMAASDDPDATLYFSRWRPDGHFPGRHAGQIGNRQANAPSLSQSCRF